MSKKDTCKACGGFEFSLSDGFMYCDRCGTLLENFEELEEEEGGMHQTIGAGRIKTKNDGKEKKKRLGNLNFDFVASNEERMAKEVEKRSDFLKEQIPRVEDLPLDKTPDYLYSVGLRLFSFTQILSKSAHILANEMNFDSTVREHSLAVFQRYLVHCQVAFCADEQCGADEDLRFEAVMENVFYEEEEREEKRRKKLARRGKGVAALSKSAAAWQLLTQGNITEHLDLESEDDEDDVGEGEEEDDGNEDTQIRADETTDETNVADRTMGFVRKVTTALSVDALRRASQILLNLEILVAILHSALMCTGYQDIMVSDVVRWIREDRFRISRKSLSLLKIGFIDGNNETSSTIDKDWKLKFPLYEIMRTSAIFQQSVNLTAYQESLIFDKMAARIIDNLNLPVDILNRVLLLESMAPCDVDSMLRRQVDIRIGNNLNRLACVPKKELLETFMMSFGRKEMSTTLVGGSDEVLFSPETKILAYILLALKLTFNIDSEPSESPSDLEDDENDNDDDNDCHHHFDIDTWIHQLEMRLKCWQGHDMTMVLRQSCPIPDILTTLPFGDDHFIKPRHTFAYVARHRRQRGFRQCLPPEMSFHSTSNLPTVFDLRENRYRAERNRDAAVLAPLKFQTTVLQREIDTKPGNYESIDLQSRRTFFRDFRKFRSTEEVEHFDEFFPNASCYSPYSRPEWISNCTSRQTIRSPATGPFRIFLGLRAIEDIYGMARPSFSNRFHFLLSTFSLLIGEDQKAVYAAFVMLETLVLSAENSTNVRSELLSSHPISIDGIVYGRSLKYVTVKYGIVPTKPVEKIEELRYFALSCRFFEHPELAVKTEDVEFLKFSRNHQIHEAEESDDQETSVIRKRELSHRFETFFTILAVKIW